MKKTLKTILILAGAALVTTVAQANPYTIIASDTMTDTLTRGHGTALPVTFTVLSQVYTDGTDYEYTYTIAGSPSVNQLNVSGLVGSSITSYINPAGFTGVFDGASTVNWDTASSTTLLSLSGLTFGFYSSLPPINGGAGAQDGTSWSDGASVGVNVPGVAVPDGGLTMALMGGTLLGLGALRRKFSC